MLIWCRTVGECRERSKVPVCRDWVAFAMQEMAGEVGAVVVGWAAFVMQEMAEMGLAVVVERVERVCLEDERWRRSRLA